MLQRLPDWADRPPKAAERRLLEVLYDAFLEHGAWPQYANVEAILDRDHRVELEDVLADLPIGLLWPDPAASQQIHDQQELAPTLYGLTFVDTARADVSLFVELYRWGAKRRRDYVPPPTESQELLVSAVEAATELSGAEAGVTAQDVLRAVRLGSNESPTLSIRGSLTDASQAIIALPRELRRFSDIEGVDDYFRRRRPPFRALERKLPEAPDDGTPMKGVARGIQRLSSDRPLTDPRSDLFGYSVLARHLAEALAANPAGDAVVVAIHGSWGLGKSTLLNFVLHYTSELGEDTRPYVVRFNPWWFSGSEDLVARFFDALEVGLGRIRSLRVRRAASKLRRFADRIESVPVPYGEYAAFGLRLLAGKNTLDGVKVELETALRKLERRVLVVIDDVDRLSNSEIRQMFKLVKAVADFPNVTYLLAFDPEVVATALAEGSDLFGAEYLEKIVQLTIELPFPDGAALWSALDAEIAVIAGLDSETLRSNYAIGAWMTGLRHFFSTPRDVVRVANAMKLAYPVLGGEVNVTDLIVMEALRLNAPTAWNVVRTNADAFAGPRPIQAGGRSSGPDEAGFHQQWLDALPESEARMRGPLTNLLAHIFPRLAGVLGGSAASPNYRDSIFSSRFGRMCSPSTISTYFRLAVPPGAIGRVEMREIIDSARDADSYRDRLQQLATDPTPPDGTRLGVFIQQLLDYVEDPEARQVLGQLLEVPLTSAGELVELAGGWSDHDHVMFERLVVFLLPGIPQGDRVNLLARIVEMADTLLIPLSVVRSLGDEDASLESRLLDDVGLDALKRLLLGRIRTSAADRSLIHEPRLISLLYEWDSLERDAASQWVRSILDEPSAIGALLEATVTVVRSGSAGDWIPKLTLKIDPRGLDPFVERSRLRAFVEAIDGHEALTQGQRRAVTLYLQGCEALDAGHSPI
jgi:predicted KAP-like P-loop ATPase